MSYNKKKAKIYRETHKEQIAAKGKIYRATHQEQIRKRQREWIASRPEKHDAACRKSYLKILYSLTVDEYDAISESQGGRCAICGSHQSELSRRLYIDHDHKTNQIRGLLCHRCNIILGNAKDNTEILLSAVEYLIAHGKDGQDTITKAS